MFPILEVLVAVIIAKVSMSPADIGETPDWWTILALQIVGLAAAHAAAGWTARRLARGSVEGAARAHERSFLAVRLAAIALYAVQVRLLGWPGVLGALGVARWILLDEILVLAPFFLFLVGAWSASYGVEKRFRFHRWTRTGYVMFQLRQRLLPLAPILFLFALNDTLRVLAGKVWLVGRFKLWMETAIPVQWAVVISSFVLIMIVAPFLFRGLWGMRPLPAGPLRNRLEEFGRRVGFRTRDILLWPTRNNVLNAAIIGLTGRFRYVVITDGLIRSLSEDEIEAVYAHEVGHAKHRHMLLFLLFAISFMFVLHLLTLLLEDRIRNLSVEWLIAAMIGLSLLWWGVLFGWISRRIETQADVYGATATARAHEDGDASAFISALENLAEESGQIRHLRGLRHPSIAERTDFLRRYLAEPAVRSRHRRSVRWLTAVLSSLFLLVTGLAVATLPNEWRRARIEVALKDRDYIRAIDACRAFDPGPRRAASLTTVVERLAHSQPTEAYALDAAHRLLALAQDDPEDLHSRLGIGYLLVVAAEQARDRDAFVRALEHIEAAGPILFRVARAEIEGDNEDERSSSRDLAAEAAMLLGRSFLRIADLLAERDGTAAGDEWRKGLYLARTWLEEAERLEPAGRDGTREDFDQIRLRGEIQARTGRLDEAVDTFRTAGRAARRTAGRRRLTFEPRFGWEQVVVDARIRAPLDRDAVVALADWVEARPATPGERPRLCLTALSTLVVAAGMRPPGGTTHSPDVDHDVLVDLIAPALARLADPEAGNPRVPDQVRAGALHGLANLYRLLATDRRLHGRDLEGWALWRKHLLDLAADVESRARSLL